LSPKLKIELYTGITTNSHRSWGNPQGFENNTIESNASEEAHQNRFSCPWEKRHASKSIGAMVNVSRGRYSIVRRMRFRMRE
jgi:hypothetical protein